MNSLTAPTLKAHTRVSVKRVTQETGGSALKVRLHVRELDFHSGAVDSAGVPPY